MNQAVQTDEITLWQDRTGIPLRMIWRGRRWRVSDTPTEPEGFYWTTHLPPMQSWRFQATADDGGCLVFDVVERAGTWHVVHTYGDSD